MESRYIYIIVNVLVLFVIFICQFGREGIKLAFKSREESLTGFSSAKSPGERVQVLHQLQDLQLRAQHRHVSIRKSLVSALETQSHRMDNRLDLEFTRGIMGVLLESHSSYRLCPVDHTLPMSRLLNHSVYLAMCVSQAEELMPNLLAQLATLSSYFQDPNQLFVSIYESGSRDATGWWLNLISVVLTSLEVPHNITTDGRRRARGEHRIDFLSDIRNDAMWSLYNRQFKVEPDKVIFVNDVYFCASDIARLLMHDADIACGLDFHKGHGPFYDIWVTRDITGVRFKSEYPFAQHDESIARMLRGLPIPASSCWNGLAVLRAEPFLKYGLKFRNYMPGECKHGECSLVADDFFRLGFPNVIIDPAVRVAYKSNHAWYMHTNITKIPRISWQEALDNPFDPQVFTRQYEKYECYDRFYQGTETIDFRQPRYINLLKPNFTSVFLEVLKNKKN